MLRRNRSSIAFAALVMALFVTQATGTSALAQVSSGTLTGSPGEDGANLPAETNSLELAIPDGPGFLAVNPYAFVPSLAIRPAGFQNLDELYNPNANDAIYRAPLSLPNGVTIRKMVLYFYDNNPGTAVWITLLKCPFTNYNCTGIAAIYSQFEFASPSLQKYETQDITEPVIDLQSNSYAIEARLSSGTLTRIKGVRIDYANMTMLPTVLGEH